MAAAAFASAADAQPAVALPSYKNLGQCGASGRWGEAPEEKLFFLKTTKTAGSSIRSLFARFARSERMAVLRSTQDGGILFPADGRSQRWVESRHFEPVSAGSARARSGPAVYDVAYDHSTMDVPALRRHLPGARCFTSSREVVSRIVSAIALFRDEATAQTYFNGCRKLTPRNLCAGPFSDAARLSRNNHRIWNSVAWQLGAPLPRADFTPTGRDVLDDAAARLARIPVDRYERFVEGPGNDTFALVLLVERLDESLVLLRSLLCWRWVDIITEEPPLAPMMQEAGARKIHRTEMRKKNDGTGLSSNLLGKSVARPAPPPVKKKPPPPKGVPTKPQNKKQTNQGRVKGRGPFAPGRPLDPSKKKNGRSLSSGKRPLPESIARTIAALNPLDAAVHAASKRAFERRAVAYGADRLRADAAFFRRFRFSFAVACLGCLFSDAEHGAPPAYDALPCDALKPTCLELHVGQTHWAPRRKTEDAAASTAAVAARRSNDAAAEAAVVALVHGCDRWQNATVCPHAAELCATGEVCAAGADGGDGRPLALDFPLAK